MRLILHFSLTYYFWYPYDTRPAEFRTNLMNSERSKNDYIVYFHTFNAVSFIKQNIFSKSIRLTVKGSSLKKIQPFALACSVQITAKGSSPAPFL